MIRSSCSANLLLASALLASAALAACHAEHFPEPTAPTKPAPDPSSGPLHPSKPKAEPRMQPLARSKAGADLKKLGLDPDHLPKFASLTAAQVRGVMPIFSSALGLECEGCHEKGKMEAPTRMKHMAERMWDEFLVGYSAEGSFVFCDSCHQGQVAFLRRVDHEMVSKYMSDNFTDKLKRADKKEVVCETCHGDPAEPLFLMKW